MASRGVDAEKTYRFIIQGKDKPLVVYDDTYSWDHFVLDLGQIREFLSGGEYHVGTISCKAFTPPPKPSAVLMNLTTPTLPNDVIDLIASFDDDVHCESCILQSFNMSFLEKCRTALSPNEWARFQREVEKAGGSCRPVHAL